MAWLLLLPSLAAPAPAFPAFTLPDTTGRMRADQELRGRPAVVGFWASWCAPCVAELPLLDALARRHPEWAIWEINVDAQAGPALGVLRRLHLSLPVLFDPRSALIAQLAPPGLPVTYVLDAQGTVRARHDHRMDDAEIALLEAEMAAMQ